MRKPVDRAEQAVPDAFRVEFVVAHDRHEVALAQLQQLDQPMFDFNIAMAACFTQAGRIGQRASTMIVKAAQEWGNISGSHGNG
ncbi:hypothetical protein GCM10011400_32240 [Paraburkholderia caffeinilytica]|uniref:Uncharacterized protein n=1 Tax=Paraburkholderia caffeinilytica TaxID=1761016 RepID=A0ABQ1MQE4_9BURK|nr:hypothetical protein GCM10011400_32240 [Paraburkholderia caffeinilytica]